MNPSLLILCAATFLGACEQSESPKQSADLGAASRETPVDSLRMGYMSTPPGDSIRFAVTEVPLSRLVRFLADGTPSVPAPGPDGESVLDPSVRLHAVGTEGPCVDGTHFICYHDYLLTVRMDWTDAHPKAFDLGQVGEIEGFRWVSGDTRTHRLSMVLRNWPTWVIETRQNHTLVRDSIELAFDSDSLWVASRTRLP